ncbi:MAG: endonuclease V [Natronincolaceae bacterium]|jgi:deoxyribonuclease V|nr:endonuclease V [Bacillota bacterium]
MKQCKFIKVGQGDERQMDNYKIACFDAYYREDCAKTCCILFETGTIEKNILEYCKITRPTEKYIPGEFYKRELPGILEVYWEIKRDINLVIVDGYVLLKDGKIGLGGHLYRALEGRIPVIGVAKSYFVNSRNYIKVYRGESNRPLYVSSIGIETGFAANLIKNLDGRYRIPNMLKRVDRLTRS